MPLLGIDYKSKYMKKNLHIPTIRELIQTPYVLEISTSLYGDFVAFSVRTTAWNDNRFITRGYIHNTTTGDTWEIESDIWNLCWRNDHQLAFLKNAVFNGKTQSQVHLYDVNVREAKPVTGHATGIQRYWFIKGHLLYIAENPVKQNLTDDPIIPFKFVGNEKRNQEIFLQRLIDELVPDGKIDITMISGSLDSGYTQLMEIIVNRINVYCTCRKGPDFTDVDVFRIELPGVDNQQDSTASTSELSYKWEKLPLPTNAGLLAVSPDGNEFLINWDSENPKGYCNEAPAIWITDAPYATHPLQRLVPEIDRYILQASWTTGGIIVRYLEGTHARLAMIINGSLLPIDLGKYSALAFHAASSRMIVVYAASTDEQPQLMIINLNKETTMRQFVKITHLADCISFNKDDDEIVQQWAWGKQKTIRWQNDVGVSLEGVLYLPDDFEMGKRYPLLVIAHGGPGIAEMEVRRGWEDCWVYPVYQILNRGVLILKPNYRGSDGYGRNFHEAHIASGGANATMLADVESGVHHLIGTGIVDSERVGLAGYSAGGGISAYAAVKSNCFCAISVGAGASDQLIYLAESCYPGWSNKVLGGEPWEVRDRWIADSSAWQRVSKRTPTLIQHGESDTICPIGCANALYITLSRQGVTTVFARFPQHGHGIFNYCPRSAFAVMTQNLKWFSHFLLDDKLDWEMPDKLDE